MDSSLVNPWGLSFARGTPVWVANNRSSTATLYDGTGFPILPIVSLPSGVRGNANPTGIVANTSADFAIGSTTGPASFIFCGRGGTISAWAQANDDKAVKMYDDVGGAVYTGITIATYNGANLLYAADFRNNKIDVFDTNFSKTSLPGTFGDFEIKAGFAPFGIQAVGNRIYVTYAKQIEPQNREPEVGAGLGYVNLFSADGNLLLRVATTDVLNAPWGIAVAPSGFGKLSGTLLVANFGDGVINAFDPFTGVQRGTLQDMNAKTIVIPGLRGIAFGNGVFAQSVTTLYFTAGPNNGANGIYGSIAATTAGTSASVPQPLRY